MPIFIEFILLFFLLSGKCTLFVSSDSTCEIESDFILFCIISCVFWMQWFVRVTSSVVHGKLIWGDCSGNAHARSRLLLLGLYISAHQPTWSPPGGIWGAGGLFTWRLFDTTGTKGVSFPLQFAPLLSNDEGLRHLTVMSHWLEALQWLFSRQSDGWNKKQETIVIVGRKRQKWMMRGFTSTRTQVSRRPDVCILFHVHDIF